MSEINPSRRLRGGRSGGSGGIGNLGVLLGLVGEVVVDLEEFHVARELANEVGEQNLALPAGDNEPTRFLDVWDVLFFVLISLPTPGGPTRDGASRERRY